MDSKQGRVQNYIINELSEISYLIENLHKVAFGGLIDYDFAYPSDARKNFIRQNFDDAKESLGEEDEEQFLLCLHRGTCMLEHEMEGRDTFKEFDVEEFIRCSKLINKINLKPDNY